MHVTWINEIATLKGGCEHYIHRTASLLHERGVLSSILYDPLQGEDAAFLKPFRAGAFPLVEPELQLKELGPDVVFVHQLQGTGTVEMLTGSGLPVVRFFHDHRLFCLRDYKYTAVGHKSCGRVVGPACYAPCLGFVHRREQWPRIGIRTLRSLKKEQRANRALDAFVVSSQYMAEHVAAHGFDRNRIHVIPLYVPSIAQRQGGRARDRTSFLFVGQLVRGKGLDLLIEALVRIPEARVRVVGRGRQEGLFRKMAQDTGVADRVEFHPGLSSKELEEAYRRCAAVVFPTRAETFGWVGPEAMSFGAPVIASRVGGVTEWLDDGVTGLAVCPGDAGELAQAMRRILDHPEWAAQLGEAGRQRVQERFLPEMHLDRLIALFDRVRRKGHKDRRVVT